MNDVTIASSEADAQAAEAVERHHAQMAGALAVKAESLSAAARAGRPADADEVRARPGGLVPHRAGAARPGRGDARCTGPPRAMPEGRLLVEAMLAEHQRIIGLRRRTSRRPPTRSRRPRWPGRCATVFESHLAKENDQVLPLLVCLAGVSVADLLGGMHELLGGHDGHEARDRGPARLRAARATPAAAPRRRRRATPSSTPAPSRTPSGTPRSSAPSTPSGPATAWSWSPRTTRCRCSRQLEQRAPGAFAVDYLERGPEAWRLAAGAARRLKPGPVAGPGGPKVPAPAGPGCRRWTTLC